MNYCTDCKKVLKRKAKGVTIQMLHDDEPVLEVTVPMCNTCMKFREQVWRRMAKQGDTFALS